MRQRSELDSLLLKALTGAVSVLVVSLITWATWATSAIFEIKADIKTLKVANHLALSTPELSSSKVQSRVLASPNFGESLVGFFFNQSAPVGKP